MDNDPMFCVIFSFAFYHHDCFYGNFFRMPPDAERLHMGSGHIDRNAENAKEDECEEDEREARDGDDDDDAKLMESRRWDDFKDENPRGWGNSRR